MPPGDDFPRFERIHDPLELIDPPPLIGIGWLIAFAVVLIAAVWFGARRFLRRRRARLASPERIASDRLWRIEPDAMPLRELFRELHAVLVEYLTARAGFGAAWLTSPEILSSYQSAGYGAAEELRRFLADSDRARFSPAAVAPSVDRRDTVRQCRAVIEQVEAKRKQEEHKGGKRRRAV